MRTDDPTVRPTAQSVADLFTRYLERQVDAHAQGLGYPEGLGEAVPHEAVPVQPVDPQLAWRDALSALQLLGPDESARLRVPADWAGLVTQQEPAVALAFCLGNYPQQVRNLHLLLGTSPTAQRQSPARPLSLTGLSADASPAREGDRLLTAALLRLAGQYDRSAELLAMPVSPAWQAALANETAALAWHRGEAERARALWRDQADSVPVLFNRGMSALFAGATDEATAALRQALAGLPETSAWHHLACLYLALARP